MSLLRENGTVAALALAAVLLMLPLWLVGAPAMPDYPARLAGFYLIAGEHSLFYSVHWAVVPNLASEVLVPLLGRIMTLENAARVFLSAAIAMWVAGPALIHRTLYGRVGVMPLAGAVCAYNSNFMWGFFNYYFTVGLCLIAFAGWIASEKWRLAPRLAVFVPAALVLYFSHVLGAALFLFLVACHGATRSPPAWRRLFIELAVLGVPIAALFLLQMHGAGSEIDFDIVASFPVRLTSIVQSRFEANNIVVLVGLGILLAAAWRSGVLSVHRRMRLAVGGIALAAILVPAVAMGGWGLHLRFPAVAALLLFASSEIAVPRRAAAMLGGVVLAVTGWMSFALAQSWGAHDKQVKELRAALDDVPRRTLLLTAIDIDHMDGVRVALYWHLAEFGIIDRDDATSLMFTTKGQSLVSPSPEIARYIAGTAQEGSPPSLEHLAPLAVGDTRIPKIRNDLQYLLRFPCHYDEVLLYHVSGKPGEVPAMLKARHEGSFFTLYDVTRPAGCSTISATRP